MIDAGKRNVLGVLVDQMDYEAAVERVIDAAKHGKPLGVSALAVHGVMTGVLDESHRYRLNRLDLVLPDGQPVRWALNLMHRSGLRDRVYGPTLTLKICERAAADRLPVYLYGSRAEVLEALGRNLVRRFPGLEIAGRQPSRFRRLSAEEKQRTVEQIRSSGARLLLLGLGCPRQEVWAYEYRDPLSIPVIAVGAAFDFHAGNLPQAPPFLQRHGLEWAYRLCREPARLWKRYLFLNPLYVWLIVCQLTRLKEFSQHSACVPREEWNYG